MHCSCSTYLGAGMSEGEHLLPETISYFMSYIHIMLVALRYVKLYRGIALYPVVMGELKVLACTLVTTIN